MNDIAFLSSLFMIIACLAFYFFTERHLFQWYHLEKMICSVNYITHQNQNCVDVKINCKRLSHLHQSHFLDVFSLFHIRNQSTQSVSTGIVETRSLFWPFLFYLHSVQILTNFLSWGIYQSWYTNIELSSHRVPACL